MGKRMNQKRKCKPIVYGVVLLLALTTIPYSTVSTYSKQNAVEETIKICVINTFNNHISEYYLSTDEYTTLVNAFQQSVTSNTNIESLSEKVTTLELLKLLSLDQATFLRSHYKTLETKYLSYNYKDRIFGFDALNLFNGIAFFLKGEKISSLIDLNVFNFHLLNSNISALFSAYSEFQGNGFIISLGTLGFQSILSFSVLPDFRFSEIHGAIVGFTGLLIVTDSQAIGSEEATIMGIGLDILTYWDKIE